MSRFRMLPLAVGLAAVLSAPPCRADVLITPFIGPYIPATRMVFDIGDNAVIQATPATAVGGALTWRTSPRLALETAVTYGRGELSVLGGAIASVDAAYINTDARARIALGPGTSPVRWELVTGVGAHRLRGLFADVVRAQSPAVARVRLSGVAGVSVSREFADGIRLRLDVLDHMHGSGLDVNETQSGFASSRAVQHDIAFTIGAELPAPW